MKYVFKGFTEKANTALNMAIEAAQQLGHTYIGTEHIVLGLLREGTGVAATVLNGQGVTAAQYEQKITEAESGGQPTRLTPEDFTPRTKRAMETAVLEARGAQQSFVGTEHILIAVLRDETGVAVRLLSAMGIRPVEMIEEIARSIGSAPVEGASMGASSGNAKPAGNGKTPTLDQFGRDLTEMAKAGKNYKEILTHYYSGTIVEKM